MGLLPLPWLALNVGGGVDRLHLLLAPLAGRHPFSGYIGWFAHLHQVFPPVGAKGLAQVLVVVSDLRSLSGFDARFPAAIQDSLQ